MKRFVLICTTVFLLSNLTAQKDSGSKNSSPNLDLFTQGLSSPAFCPAEIKEFMAFYPDLEYSAIYDIEVQDWKIDLSADLFYERTNKPKGRKTAVFYWADGRMLPKEELPQKDNYWTLRYPYSNTLRDPKTFTDEELEQIRKFSSTENRKNGGGSPMFFFDFLYSAQSRVIIEDHIIRTKFLGKSTRIHERVYDALKRIEKKILENADDAEVKTFIDTLKSADAYCWREIAGTSRKSFHSYGIAIDVLPKRLAGRSIYWDWERNRSGDNWMLVPLEKRWTPGSKVIKIFEDEGFIWGGYWLIFDNMHFEYHPELIGNQ
ncbi:M15 family metallopeptidase [uncultured Treponema sp.]|uniref:M15 family metallopeptidase n=1 Tax=uncultured Treponema sp. TaxID=162155 RepID=UPI0025DC3065|nr:M15 family metallopeptidase [uncultured Treponema sp.]